MWMKTASVVLLLALTACSGQDDSSDVVGAPPSDDALASTTPSASSSAPAGVAPLEDGTLTPGRYRYDMLDTCDHGLGCPTEKNPELPDVLVTVPAGWNASNEFHLIEPAIPAGTGAPDGAGLVMGWTNYWAGMQSHPCSKVSHQQPDIEVGPTVDDFVDAIVAHPRLHVTDPKPVKLGKYRGRFFTLIGPSDISKCTEWRPWEPSPYLQGPRNRWDLWVMDVDGVRVVIMAGYYPGTSSAIKNELRDMAESIRFAPSKA